MRIVMLLAVFLIYGGANYYSASRVFRLLKLLGLHISVPVFVIAFSLLSATVFLSFTGKNSAFSRIVSGVGSVWMGILMYLFIYTVLADIVILMIKLAGCAAAPVKIAAETAVLLLTAITVIGGAVHAGRIQIARYTVETGRSTEPIRIVLASDIHVGALGVESRLNQMAAVISSEEPDIVCFAGDIFNNDFSAVRDPAAVADAFRSIRSKYGVFACLGNHDCGNGFEQMTKLLSQAGVTLLCEEASVVPDRCIVYGRADSSPIGETGGMKRQIFDRSGITGTDELPVIVLDHNPANYDEYGEDVDLILCGHTHKGQMFPGPLITGAMYAVDYGMFRASTEKPTAVVTSGFGYWGPPLRVGTDSEIAVIELQ